MKDNKYRKLCIAGICTCFLLLATYTLSSCNDFLDVRSETEAKEEDLFTKKGGFKDALTGIYLTMADRSAYGEYLTMNYVEQLANLWYTTSSMSDTYIARYWLAQHDYDNEYAKDVIKEFYGKLFNVALQSNLLLKNIQEQGDVVDDRQLREVIEGEAYAIRAYVHLDILRLFGQLPKNATINVRLPYCETTTIDEIPAYYDFNAYVQKLQNDLSQALEHLAQADPVMNYSLSYYDDSGNIDDYLLYRRFRLNYWAVKALQARTAMYLGQTQQAHDLALEVINAKGREDSENVVTLSGLSDLSSGYTALPGECLFALSKFDLLDYTLSLLIGGSNAQVYTEDVYSSRIPTLCVSESMFNDLFAGVNTASNNRYLNVWNRQARTNTGSVYPVVKKYWYDTTNSDMQRTATFNNLLIPMIRLSEMYLIAIETTTSLAEANSLWNTYQRSCNVLLTEDAFNSLSEVQPVVQAEFLREFYAEGQMFYYYKRLGSTQMKWRVPAVEESEYILPLPETEYEPTK